MRCTPSPSRNWKGGVVITNQQMTELRLLQLRSLVADKEVVIQNMERENQLGGWLFDHNEGIRQIEELIVDKQKEILGL